MVEQVVELQPIESKIVSFEAIPQEAKTYQVNVDGLTGSFVATKEPLMLSFTNPHHTRTWAWKPYLYDFSTEKWQHPPTTYNDPAGTVMFRVTGNSFLLYVSEYYRDIDGDSQIDRLGPYLIEAPEILRGDYTWDSGIASLVGEHTISGQLTTGTGHRCTVTGIITNVSHRDDNKYIRGEFIVEEIIDCSGLGVAQYFINKKFLLDAVNDATAHDDKNRWSMVSSGMRITMDLYMGYALHWYGMNVHRPLEHPSEFYSFSGSVVYVSPVPDKCLAWSGTRCTHWLITYGDLYHVTVSSPYLGQFGAVILAWGATDHEIEKFNKLVAPTFNYEFDISEGSYFYLLAHPDPSRSFSGGWVKEEWIFNNWKQVASGKA